MTEKKTVDLEGLAIRIQGISDLLIALSTAMEQDDSGFEDGVLLLANVSMQIAEELREAQEEE